MPENIEISKRFKAIREALGFNQTQFAQRLSSSPTAISELEKGKYKPNLDMVIKIVDVFKVNFYYLAFGEGEMFSQSGKRGLDIPQKLFADSDVTKVKILEFLNHLDRSSFLLFSIMSHYRFLLKKEEKTIQREFKEYEKKKGGEEGE
ncbi:MAG: helix-turn-helix transcriptional regulator [bacterium]|nr:helix-turn-helix transcriptional regulator [bacterium]